ncbi:YqjF family protein [Actinomadura sp. HBU206391]|uniref:YqjF family protein n=1 Tax=Actinomadura sp. HBU206391 TaxID=2731692 RepID=UPI001650BF0F|nr:DUF2071 domain-containing protein [Actinomadura sp. HBU206391]MBC6461905.1 DUF2071 domain-containing protein [Actinomadura sp. HBU206391]
MSVEPVSPQASRPVRRSFLVQRWHDLAFVHWAAAPRTVQPFLPEGTRADTLDGVTYVGLIGFRMVRMGLLAGPGLPYFGTFCETNVRLYSVDGEGRRGVVFLSLDAARLLPVLIARASLRLPYQWSAMRLDRDGDVYTYTSRRRWPDARGARSRMVVRVGEPIAEPTAVEHFVTARWGLHVRAHGRTLYLPNIHPQWPLHRARLQDLDADLVAASGLPAFTEPPASVLYSPAVAVRFGAPMALRRSPPALE